VRIVSGQPVSDGLAAVGHVVGDSIDAQGSHAAEVDREADVTLYAVIVSTAVGANVGEILTCRLVRLIAGVAADHTTSSQVDGGDARDGEAIADASRHGAVPDCTVLTGACRLRTIVRVLRFEIPVGGEICADSAADSPMFIELQRVVELRVLPKSA